MITKYCGDHQFRNLIVGGAHIQGRGGSYQAGRTRPWQASVRPPARFSNAGLAVIICIPLVFTGVLLGQ